MIAVSDIFTSRNRQYFHFAMSDEEQHATEMKSYGFDESGSDFSLGCFGTTGDKYPMEELDEWDSEEVRPLSALRQAACR